MMVLPLADRRRARPVAVVIAAGRRTVTVATLDGEIAHARGPARCGELLGRFSSWQLYAACPMTALLGTTGAQAWTGYQWRGGLVRLALDGGPVVHPMRRELGGHGPAEVVGGLAVALGWLGDRGVIPGSRGSMAWRLWRSTLAGPVRLSGPRHRHALYGGRQEAPWPGNYACCRSYDLSSAYPAAMAGAPYPTRLLRVKCRGLDLGAGVGLARARVRLPRLRWGALPVRVGPGAVCFGWGEARGWWSWLELDLARQLGATVDLEEAWAGVAEADLFGPWWAAVAEGRALGGLAGAVVKAVTSSLWGRFALDPAGGAWVRWSDDAGRRPVVVRAPANPRLPHLDANYVAAETTARVRRRLYVDALAVDDHVLYCDTDGYITSAEPGRAPTPNGGGPGTWTLRETMVVADIRGPQVLRWTCPTCDTDHPAWHHLVAGAPDRRSAAAVFARDHRRRGAWAGAGPGDITLPAGPLEAVSGAPGGLS